MVTNIWLKGQPNKRLQYPDCYPVFSFYVGQDGPQEIEIKNNTTGATEAIHRLRGVLRQEYRPA